VVFVIVEIPIHSFSPSIFFSPLSHDIWSAPRIREAMPAKNFQYVWPKDGPHGKSGHRGFFGRLNNVVTGRGPDIFIQRKHSKTPISPDHWQNWDSYHDFNCYRKDHSNGSHNPLYDSSRGFKRYDPHTRRYREWFTPHDWAGFGVDARGVGPNDSGYPRFTTNDARKMTRRLAQGRRVNPARMGDEWHHDGPRRFQQEYDYFWQEAHRRGENRRQGLPYYYDINPNFIMGQQFPADLERWVKEDLLKL